MSHFPCKTCGKMIGVVNTTVYSCECAKTPTMSRNQNTDAAALVCTCPCHKDSYRCEGCCDGPKGYVQLAGKYPIDRPCSACSGGDTEMKYHDHHPPFRKGYGPESPAPLSEPTGLTQGHIEAAPLSEEAARREFEEWALKEFYEGIPEATAPARKHWGYADDDVHDAWKGWLACAKKRAEG